MRPVSAWERFGTWRRSSSGCKKPSSREGSKRGRSRAQNPSDVLTKHKSYREVACLLQKVGVKFDDHKRADEVGFVDLSEDVSFDVRARPHDQILFQKVVV